MIDPKNVSVLTGNLTRDPQIVGDGIILLSVAVNYGGSDTQDPENKAGYFDVVVYSNASNYNFIKGQIDEGKMSKASSVSVVGRLHHDRFLTKEDTKSSKVKIIAEAVSYAGSGASTPKDTSADAAHVASVPTDW